MTAWVHLWLIGLPLSVAAGAFWAASELDLSCEASVWLVMFGTAVIVAGIDVFLSIRQMTRPRRDTRPRR